MPKLYWLPLSPPARIVYFFAKAANISIETVSVDLSKGEQKKPEFLAINPHGQVPALSDDGFNIFESSAIVRYLAAKHPNSVFPTNDPKKQAQIDMHFELIKSKIQDSAAKLVFNLAFAKAFFGRDPDEAVVKQSRETLATNFAHLESTIYKDSPHHVVGNHLSLADVLLGVLLSQLSIINFDLSPFPKTHAFFENLQTLPSYKESHVEFNQAIQPFKK